MSVKWKIAALTRGLSARNRYIVLSYVLNSRFWGTFGRGGAKHLKCFKVVAPPPFFLRLTTAMNIYYLPDRV